MEEFARSVEHVHETVAYAGYVVARGPDLGVRDVEETTEILNVEWSVAIRDLRVLESSVPILESEGAVEDVDGVVREVGRVEPAAADAS